MLNLKTEVYDFDKGNEKWHRLVNLCPSSPFHTVEWLSFLQKAFNIKIWLLTVSDGNSFLAGVPFAFREAMGLRFWSSLPFSNRGGPIYSNPESLINLTKSLSKWVGPSVDFAQIRTVDETSAKTLTYHGFTDYGDQCDLTLDLTMGSKLIWGNVFSSERRRQIRKAESLGVEIKEVNLRNVGDNFYDLYRETMVRCGGLLFHRRVFLVLYEEVPFIKTFGAKYHGRFISFSVSAFHKDDVYGIFHVSKLDAEVKHLFHNDAMYWHSIRWDTASRFKNLYLGPSTENPQNGLYLFKSRFGAKPIHIHDLYKPFTWKGKLFLKTIKKIRGTYEVPLIKSVLKHIPRDRIPL